MILDPRTLWSMAEVAEYSRYSATQVRRIVAQPDFPTAIRVYAGAHPRWKAGEVMEYFEAKREAA